jgi:predicted ATPase/class 3 adenylate cyclase
MGDAGAAGALPAGTVTFLFTDLEGSTALLEAHPVAYRDAVARHHALLRGAVEGHGGAVFETVGDAVYAAFARPTDAVAAALAGQQGLQAADWGELGAGAIRARMGLHTGEVERQGAHYFGAPLYRCARLMGAAHGGQTVLSEAAAALVRGALPAGVGVRDLGAHRLKDLREPERVFQLLHPDLPGDFPPLRSLDARPHNLPLQLTSFVGRERELAAVAALLGGGPSGPRLVTLTGPGGTGKTRLALQAAADALEAHPDGVWLVELAALADPALVPQAVAAPVGVREEPGRPLAATLTDALRPKRLLLLLDNCEHLVDACARLAEALLRACPALRVLATSREALGVAGEAPYPVPPLSLPELPEPPDLPDAGHPPARGGLAQAEAVRLFVERATTLQPAFAVTAQNARPLAELCRRLDGLPLALELAAARVPVLGVEGLLARLDDRFRLLTGGSRTALERHQTLQATVDWSHALLTAPERVLFRRLAVFAGGWGLEAAEQVCSDATLPQDDVLDLLTRLVDKSLVLADAPAAGPARYRLLETLRQYAQHKLADAEEVAAVRGRHAAVYLALAEQAEPALYGPEQLAWLDRLEQEHANLLAALAWLAERGAGGEPEAPDAAEAALRLGAALARFWVMRSHVALAGEWLGRLLALPGAQRTAARARVLAGAGHVAFWRRDYAAGRRLAGETLALAQAVGDGFGIAFARLGLGSIARTAQVAAWRAQDAARAAQEAATARAHLEASRHAFAALGSLSLVANAVQGLADVARDAGDDQGAARLYAEAEALARPTGDGWTLGHILLGRAELARRGGDYPLARRLCEEALALRRAHRDPREIGGTLALLGQVALAAGDAATARARLTEALTVLRDAGYVWDIPQRLQELARVAAAQGQPERAARLWGAAAAQHQALFGRPLSADWGQALAQATAALRAQLGDTTFAAAWAAGQAMTLEQAVAYALEEPPDVG